LENKKLKPDTKNSKVRHPVIDNLAPDILEVLICSHTPTAPVDKNAPLERKTKNPEILEKLLAIEKEIFEKAKKRGLMP
jgi:hypothetical protein